MDPDPLIIQQRVFFYQQTRKINLIDTERKIKNVRHGHNLHLHIYLVLGNFITDFFQISFGED